MGHIPVGMELFQAGNDEQWSYIKRRIDACDYYFVIIAKRYGSMKASTSYTEMEYRFARERGIPSAAFVLKRDAVWPLDRVEHGAERNLEGLVRLCEERMIRRWSSKEELARLCGLALQEMVDLYPRIGWVRADQAASVGLANELARLSQQNAELSKELENLRAAQSVHLADTADALRSKRLRTLLNTQNWPRTAKISPQTSVLELARLMHDLFLTGTNTDRIQRRIERLVFDGKNAEDQGDNARKLVDKLVLLRLVETRHIRHWEAEPNPLFSVWPSNIGYFTPRQSQPPIVTETSWLFATDRYAHCLGFAFSPKQILSADR